MLAYFRMFLAILILRTKEHYWQIIGNRGRVMITQVGNIKMQMSHPLLLDMDSFKESLSNSQKPQIMVKSQLQTHVGSRFKVGMCWRHTGGLQCIQCPTQNIRF